VKHEIRAKLDVCQKQIDCLGPERNTQAEQVVYLTKIADKFQQLVNLAMNTTHGADNSFEKYPRLRLAPAVMSRMKTFSDSMAKLGQTFMFQPKGGNKPVAGKDGAPEVEAAELLDEHFTKGVPGIISPMPARTFEIRKEDDLAELSEILHLQKGLAFPKREGINKWIQQAFLSNRGFELGTFNASLLATCMKKQCSKWEDISMGFLSDVIVMVHGFIESALEAVCTDGNIREALVNRLSDELISRYQKSLSSTKFLLEVESSDTPMTQNHYFNENLQKR
jgi:hypothetical protein